MRSGTANKSGDKTFSVHVPMSFRRRGGKKLIIVPHDAPQPSRRSPEQSPLVKVLVRGFHWKRMIETGACATLTELAAAEKVDKSYLSKVLRLTLLAPDIVEAILDGTSDLRIEQVLQPFPMEWERQRQPVVRNLSNQGEARFWRENQIRTESIGRNKKCRSLMLEGIV